jgi:hypothetical protein
MAIATALFVGQRLHTALMAAICHVCVAFATGDIRVHGRRVLDFFVTTDTVQLLRAGRYANE